MTDAVAIWGLAIGGIGSAAGIGALIYAHVANRNAKESTRIANDSKGLAVVANDLARESNTIATDARELAQEANQYSHRAESRETERNDVDWDCDWDPGQPGRYLVRKRGRDDAHNVVATITYDGHEETVHHALMREDDVLEFWFQQALADYQAEYRARENRYDPMGIAGLAETHMVNERIQWTTPLGTPHVHNEGLPSTFSLYFDR